MTSLVRTTRQENRGIGVQKEGGGGGGGREEEEEKKKRKKKEEEEEVISMYVANRPLSM